MMRRASVSAPSVISAALRSAASTIPRTCSAAGGGQRGRAALGLALELVDGLGDLTEVPVDLVGVVAPPNGLEVVSLDEVTVQFHGSDLP